MVQFFLDGHIFNTKFSTTQKLGLKFFFNNRAVLEWMSPHGMTHQMTHTISPPVEWVSRQGYTLMSHSLDAVLDPGTVLRLDLTKEAQSPRHWFGAMPLLLSF